MKSPNYLIVELDEAYDNNVELSTGESFAINSTIENVEFINRVAIVKVAPDFTILQEGDKVVVHHNIFRLRNDIKGNVADSSFHYEDNLYFVPLSEVFMYKRDSDWEAINPYCFVEPIEKEEEEGFSLSLAESSYKGRLDKEGIVAYLNDDLRSQGVQKGDRIKFSAYSEYEFKIDGKLYYKMSTKDVLAVL